MRWGLAQRRVRRALGFDPELVGQVADVQVDGYIWHRAVQESQGWKFPKGVERLIKIGNFPINAVVIDPATGIIYQCTDASMEAIPVHADVSSLAKTISSFVGYAENYTPGDEEDDEEYARRKRGFGAIHNVIRLVDLLPFAHEYSEWVELFDSLEGGIYT
ncbi:SUKH-4 family immunity protein [Streptomyces globisporus]